MLVAGTKYQPYSHVFGIISSDGATYATFSDDYRYSGVQYAGLQIVLLVVVAGCVS